MKKKVFFSYMPLQHFIESNYYDLEWEGNDLYPTWNTLSEFAISELGEQEMSDGVDYINTEIKSEIMLNDDSVQYGVIEKGKLGQEILEHNGRIYFNEIYSDMIKEVYTKEEYPEYYL